MTVEICFGSLWTYTADSSDEHLPLTQLSEENTHVHGLLQVVVGGKALPCLGFFGPDDVCFNTWVHELAVASRAVMTSDPVAYVFDEGEQGQPAFHFERTGGQVLLSVRASSISDGPGDPSWERVPCALQDFIAAVSRFVIEFRETLIAQAGSDRAERWWRHFSRANLRAARFARANVKTCSFDGADLQNADFSSAAIDSATFDGADLNGTEFRGAGAHEYTYGKGECPGRERHPDRPRTDVIGHHGRIHDGRALSQQEQRVLRWLLEHGGATASSHLDEIENLRVVARCGCGCATIDFQPAAGAPLQTLSEHSWSDDAGHAFGIAAYAIGDRLGCLEVWSLDGNATPVSLPDLSVLSAG